MKGATERPARDPESIPDQDVHQRSRHHPFVCVFLACAGLTAAAMAQEAPVADDAMVGPPQPADAVRLSFELDGVTGDLRDNVLSLLEIDDAAGTSGLTEAGIRRLHAAALRDIPRALEPFGHYRPKIDASLEPSVESWQARYSVEPGPRVPVRAVEVAVEGAGRDDPAFRDLVEKFALTPGKPLEHAPYEEAKVAFLDQTVEGGYFDAAFRRSEIVVDLDAYSADIGLVLDTGPRYRFGEVDFYQDVVRPEILTGYVPFDAGELFDTRMLARLERSLQDSGLWSRVLIEARPDRADDELRIPIEVVLVPRPRRRDAVGLGFSTDTGARVTFTMEFRRLNRSGHRGQIDFKIAELDQSAGFQYVIPRPETGRGVLRLEGGYSNVQPDTHESAVAFVGPSLSRVQGKWRQTLSLRAERHDFSIGSDSGIVELLAPGASFSRTVADGTLYPRSAFRLDLLARGGAEAVLSDVSFLRLYARAKMVRPLGSKVRVLGRLELGGVLHDDFARLPPALRFFAGGDQSVRGFGYLELGPRTAPAGDAEVGEVTGGDLLLTASAELEWRAFGDWGAALFYDVGNAFDSDAADFSFERGAGVGLRWFSPIGLVRADVAWGLSRPDPPLRVHLGLGLDL